MPDGVPVVFSAHGVPKAVPAKAAERGLYYLDATCPLVSKVHRQAERLVEQGRHILFIGHAGHPEVIGTFGQVPDGRMTLVEIGRGRRDDRARPIPPTSPSSPRPRCRSTTRRRSSRSCAAASPPSRRRAARTSATPPRTARRRSRRSRARCDAMLVIGAPNSSNSLRLVEVAERAGARARLVARGADSRFRLARRASRRSASPPAPRRPKCWCARWSTGSRAHSTSPRKQVEGVEENMVFKLPRRRSRPPDRSPDDRGRDLHRRRLQGQSGAGRLGRGDPLRRAREGAVRRRAAHHQQPDGADSPRSAR